MPPQKRDIAMVFQQYALYPHRTVKGNIEYPLRLRGRETADERDERVREWRHCWVSVAALQKAKRIEWRRSSTSGAGPSHSS